MSNSGSGSSSGVVVLVLGILSFMGCSCCTGVPAWIMGAKTIRAINEGRQPEDQKVMAQIGMVLGIVASVLGLVFVAIYFTAILAFFGIAAAGAAGGR